MVSKHGEPRIEPYFRYVSAEDKANTCDDEWKTRLLLDYVEAKKKLALECTAARRIALASGVPERYWQRNSIVMPPLLTVTVRQTS